MILADISFDTEFKIQDITNLLLRIQALMLVASAAFGLGRDPSIKPVLFFTDKAICIAYRWKRFLEVGEVVIPNKTGEHKRNSNTKPLNENMWTMQYYADT
ncbi:hypothetical protein LXL04_008991 [Taraxacum kok-saghyz]